MCDISLSRLRNDLYCVGWGKVKLYSLIYFALSSSRSVRRARLSTIGDRPFPVAASRLWNTLPLSRQWLLAPSVTVFLETSGDSSLQSVLPQISCSAVADTIIDLFTYLLTCSLAYLLTSTQYEILCLQKFHNRVIICHSDRANLKSHFTKFLFLAHA